MAGTGPAPKDVRARRGEPTRGDWVDLAPLDAPILPELPALVDAVDGEDWRAATRLTWEAWRKDPVTQMWSESDIAYAMDTIVLHHGMNASNANEVRLRMDGLGLTPKGKRDHRWRVASVEPAKTEPAKAKSSSRTAARRARLSVVK